MFELTGIDLETTSKADLHKETKERATSSINFAPDVQDRAISALRLTPEVEPPNPPSSPEHESVQEEIVPDVKEVRVFHSLLLSRSCVLQKQNLSFS